MEVAVPVPLSSPRPFIDPADYYFYTSAPASPARVAAIYTDFYSWEQQPVSPKPGRGGAEASDFDFCFDGRSESGWTAADELFEGGMIRPFMPSSVKNEGGGVTAGEGSSDPPVIMTMKEALGRDRGRALSSSPSARGRRGTRSLSPLRAGEGDHFQKSPIPSSPSVTSTSVALVKSGGCKKWKLKDLFLFRSASEGRATGRASKDPVGKYTFVPSSSSSSSLRRRTADDGGGSSGRGTSAHEMYYSANRASSEELRKKTPLPYHRHGLFGYLRYNPAIHSIKKGFSGSLFSRRQP